MNPPQWLVDAESALLACLLAKPELLFDCSRLLIAEDFYVHKHSVLYAAMLELWSAGLPVTLVELGHLLQSVGKVEDAGGYEGLAGLLGGQTGNSWRGYVDKIKDRSVARRIYNICEVTKEKIETFAGPAAEVLAEAEQSLREISAGPLGSTEPAGDIAKRVTKTIMRRAAGMDQGVPSGIKDLDDLTTGFHPGELVIIAARPSIGKTALAGTVCMYLAFAKKLPVLFVTLEQTKEELVSRLMCGRSLVNSRQLRRGNLLDEEWLRLEAAERDLGDVPLWIEDDRLNMAQLGSLARRFKMKHDIALLIVDYIQLIIATDEKVQRQEQVAEFSRGLKHLAKELHIPILALAQLNRTVEEGKGHRPTMASIRESGAIEADADLVMLLHRPGFYGDGDPAQAQLMIAKHRNGPPGEINLIFERELMAFKSA